VNKLFAFLGATLGGYAGWALGASVGPMTAFTLSVIGTAAGVYAGRRAARQLGE
jgi:outer membrane lipoprotein SlyB